MINYSGFIKWSLWVQLFCVTYCVYMRYFVIWIALKCWCDKNSCRWAIHIYLFRIVRLLFFYWWWLEAIVISFGAFVFVVFVCWWVIYERSASDSFITFFFRSLLAVSHIFYGRYLCCFFFIFSFLSSMVLAFTIDVAIVGCVVFFFILLFSVLIW